MDIFDSVIFIVRNNKNLTS